MSMLAERKRKTKWVVNPTKKPLWTSDSAGIKLGKEIMEKMGWELGKGLGQKEQGMLEPLKISYKNDTKGMGFKGKDEEWIEHQDEFNFLLSQLSSKDSSFENMKEKVQIKSLEEKSRQSKARVHYHKFTEGKDLSKYSANDLACILGTKMFKKNKKEQDEELNVKEETSKEGYETSYGVTTIKSGFIHDYFKKKGAIGKPKELNENLLPESCNNSLENIPNNCDDSPLEKKKKGKRKFESVEQIEISSKSNEVGVNFNFKSKENKKEMEIKNQENYCFKLNLDDIEKINEIKNMDILNFDTEKVPKKKKRKSKLDESEEKNLGGHMNLHNESKEMRKKQKRKEEQERKNHSTKDEFRESEINVLNDTKSKKKKKKESNSVVEKIESDPILQIKNGKTPIKKKKKKEKKEKYIEKQTMESKEEDLNVESKTKNTKQKKKNQPNGNLIESGNVEKRSVCKEPSSSENDLLKTDILKKKKKKSARNFSQLIEKKETKSLEQINEKDLNSEKGVNPEKPLESVEKVVHSHKMELFYKKKKEAVFEKAKILKLRFGFEVEKFKGSNLTDLPGYGVRQSTK